MVTLFFTGQHQSYKDINLIKIMLRVTCTDNHYLAHLLKSILRLFVVYVNASLGRKYGDNWVARTPASPTRPHRPDPGGHTVQRLGPARLQELAEGQNVKHPTA